MKIYQSIRKGFKHPDFCEDFALAFPLLEERLWVGVVSDGCSGGKNSHLSATLQCKLIRKIAIMQSVYYEEDTPIFSLAVLREFMKELRLVFSLLNLEIKEGLATLLLTVYDTKTKTVTTRILGDGLIIFDSEIIEIEQNNMPKYPVYYLESGREEVENYLTENVFTRYGCENFVISSDGVKSFMNRQNPTHKNPLNVMEYLLVDDSLKNSTKMIQRKKQILKTQYELENYDDLGILRFII